MSTSFIRSTSENRTKFDDDSENSYFTINVSNESPEPVRAEYSEVFQPPILNNANNYQMAVMIASVPTKTVPIMLDFDESLFKVCFTSQDLTKFSVQELYPVKSTFDFLPNAIFSYESVIEAMNQTLYDCYINFISGADNTGGNEYSFNGDGPQFIKVEQSSSSDKFSLLIPESWDNNNPLKNGDGVPNINPPPNVFKRPRIFFNSYMIRLFSFFNVFQGKINSTGLSDLWFEISQPPFDLTGGEPKLTTYPIDSYERVQLAGSVVTYDYSDYQFVRITQEKVQKGLWNDVTSIIIDTDMAVEKENFNNPDPRFRNRKNNKSSLISIDLNQGQSYTGDDVVYEPTNLRWIDFYNSAPDLDAMSLTISFLTKSNSVIPCFLLPGQKFTVKIAFRKKPNLGRLTQDDVAHAISNVMSETNNQNSLYQEQLFKKRKFY